MKKNTNKSISATNSTYIFPQEVVRRLKMAQNINQTVYIHGFIGCGKTSLMKNFLENKEYIYYSAEKVYPEDMNIEDNGHRQIVVIDDLQSVTQKILYDELVILLEKLCQREDIWLILLSRGMVPRWLVPLYVSHSFLAIDEKELLMDREGQELYFELWDLKPLPETEEIVWQLAAGNPLALRMCAMELSNLKSKLSMKGQSHQARQESERECIKAARNLFFQYLETQEIEHWGQETQEFLMDLSVVDEFDIELAKEITGKTDVSQHILQIQELGDILYEENGVYRFRNPFRDVLFQRLRRVCSEKRINALYYNAGHYYEIRNNLPKALEIYDQSHDEESISRILIHNARKTPAGGYYFDLRKYYLSLSESIVKENPTLMSGLSMLNSLLMNADESERWYSLLEEYAKNHTGSDRREARNQLIYLDITLPHRGSQKLQDILKNVGTLIRDHKLILREV